MKRIVIKIFSTSGLVIVSGLMLATTAFAQTSQVRSIQSEQINQTIVANRCSKVTTAVDNRTAQYDKNKQSHIDKYKRTVESVQKKVADLESKGVNVTTLKSALQTINTQIIEYGKSVDKYISILKQSKDIACGKSNGDYLAKIQEAKSQRDIVVSSIKSIRTTFVDKVIPALKDAIKQLRNN